MKPIAIYCRVSSKTQDTASQEAELSRWAETQSAPIRWYRDKLSGRTMERPGFVQMMSDLQSGEVSKVVVWRLDRLGRTAAGLVRLFEEFKTKHVEFFSLRDSLDLSTASGRLMANVLASVASYETEVRSERQLAGIAAAKAAGRKWGGSVKGRRLKVAMEQIETVRRLKGEGKPIAAIARAVSLSRGTVYGLLNTTS